MGDAVRRWIIISVVAVGAFGPARAAAGSLGDFSDSYEETEAENERTDDDDDSDDEDGGSVAGAVVEGLLEDPCDDPDEQCDRSNRATPSNRSREDDMPGIVRMMVGATPGRSFSLGRTPYQGRGRRASGGLEEGAAVANRGIGAGGSEHGFDERLSHRSHQWTVRSNALLTTRGDAGGGELFGKFTSTRMPGFAFSYQYANEFRSGTDLGFSYLTYEPNMLLSDRVTMTWNAGLSLIHSTDAIGDAGFTAGMAFEWFPVEPLLLDARANLHGFPNVWVGDLRGATGVFVTEHVAVEGNVRHLQIFEGTGLTTVGIGLRTYFGF